jgi:hypothetical protein
MLWARVEGDWVDLTKDRMVAQQLGYHGHHGECQSWKDDLRTLFEPQGLQSQLKCRSTRCGAKNIRNTQPLTEFPVEFFDGGTLFYLVGENAAEERA